MPPVGFALFTLGAPLGLVNAVAGIGALGAIFTAVAPLALSFGLSYVASILNRPKQPKPSDGQQEIRQAVPERVWIYGRAKRSGPLAFYESRSGDLYKAVLLSSRPVDEIEAIYLDDRPVTMSGNSVTSAPSYDNGDDNANIDIHSYLGGPDQVASSVLTERFTAWTSDHRLRGTAYLVMVCNGVEAEDFQEHYPTGEPQVSALIRGVEVYDPRLDGSQWSDNAALAVLDYLIHDDGYDRALEKIDLPSFIAMADLCDENVPLAAGGTEKRYRVATTVSMTEQRTNVLQRLLEACDATLYPTQGGKIAIRGGKWEAPTVMIDADEGHIIEISFSPTDAMSRYNELAIQYLDPALDYVENEGTPWLDEDDYALTGELVTSPLDLLQVPSHSQARRLAKIRMTRDNADWTVEVVTNLAGLQAIGERVITLKFPELDIDGPYWVEGGPELLDDMTGVRLKLRSANPAAYNWTTAEEGTSTSVPPDTTPDLSLDPPTLILTEGAGPTIIANWTPSDAVNRTYEVRYRQDPALTYTTMTVADTRDEAVSGEVEDDRTYYVQIRVKVGTTATGPWSAEYEIIIPPVAP